MTAIAQGHWQHYEDMWKHEVKKQWLARHINDPDFFLDSVVPDVDLTREKMEAIRSFCLKVQDDGFKVAGTILDNAACGFTILENGVRERS